MDKEYAWMPARLKTQTADKAEVSVALYKDEGAIACDGGKEAIGWEDRTVNLKEYPNKTLPLQNVKGDELTVVDDMVDLPFLHEAAILYNVKARHSKALPYTRTGDIVIAVNPYQWLNHLYYEDVQIKYANKLVWEENENDPRREVEPHVYETSALCYRGLAAGRKDQSILVSGESGAGKTETVKICMNHIASVQRGPVAPTGDDNFSDPVVDKILRSNPLLESFGNAKTTRNDNSSRFGKYLQLQFEDKARNAPIIDKSKSNCILAGSKCDVYLLEKNRVTGHEDVERTYHVLYQMCAAPDSEKEKFWPYLKGKTELDFKYVGQSPPGTKIEGMTDEEHYMNTTKVLNLIHVSDEKQRDLYQAICATMQCGNITFGAKGGDADQSELTSPEEADLLAKLIGVTSNDLSLAFTERTMKTRNETYKVPLNAEVAKESCDAFAKEIYGKLFLWLVSKINLATSAEINYRRKILFSTVSSVYSISLDLNPSKLTALSNCVSIMRMRSFNRSLPKIFFSLCKLSMRRKVSNLLKFRMTITLMCWI